MSRSGGYPPPCAIHCPTHIQSSRPGLLGAYSLSLCRERLVQTVTGEDTKVWVEMWKGRSNQETERKTQVGRGRGSKERSWGEVEASCNEAQASCQTCQWEQQGKGWQRASVTEGTGPHSSGESWTEVRAPAGRSPLLSPASYFFRCTSPCPLPLLPSQGQQCLALPHICLLPPSNVNTEDPALSRC